MSTEHTQPKHIQKMAEMEFALAKSGKSVSELCRRANIAATTWGRWKRGAVSPNIKTWDDVCSAYQSLTSTTQEGASQ